MARKRKYLKERANRMRAIATGVWESLSPKKKKARTREDCDGGTNKENVRVMPLYQLRVSEHNSACSLPNDCQAGSSCQYRYF
jgi:hypothetical protein